MESFYTSLSIAVWAVVLAYVAIMMLARQIKQVSTCAMFNLFFLPIWAKDWIEPPNRMLSATLVLYRATNILSSAILALLPMTWILVAKKHAETKSFADPAWNMTGQWLPILIACLLMILVRYAIGKILSNRGSRSLV